MRQVLLQGKHLWWMAVRLFLKKKWLNTKADDITNAKDYAREGDECIRACGDEKKPSPST